MAKVAPSIPPLIFADQQSCSVTGSETAAGPSFEVKRLTNSVPGGRSHQQYPDARGDYPVPR